MNDLSTSGSTDGNDLAAIEHDFPRWHAWSGVIPGLFYAAKTRTSPPLVFRSTTVADLRAQVERYERGEG